MPARKKWWTHCIGSDEAAYYSTKQLAEAGGKKGKLGSFIWGDRVRRLEGSVANDKAVRVGGRDQNVWIQSKHLNGKPLLELYIIDVGQGDGLLVVTPEGHHILIDGGNLRSLQNGGKNAADFVDWKFFKDYVDREDRDDPNATAIRLDAVIASHCDQDHFGGLLDLLDRANAKNAAELDSTSVEVDAFYHAGLSWWADIKPGKDPSRSLKATNDAYTKLLGGRDSAVAAVKKLDAPDNDTLSGSWGQFVKSMVDTKSADGPSKITRLSNLTHKHLPGFAPGDGKVSIRVLGPIEHKVGGKPALKEFDDGDSKNTNGHSIVLRLDYGSRRLLLTGDLNTHSQHYLMESYDDNFGPEFQCDVAKGCHHGSHDVSYKFLAGLKPLATVISSGDAETHDHPRPTIVAASALTGRKLLSPDQDTLIAPLVYATEIARSVNIKRVSGMKEFPDPRPRYERQNPAGASQIHDTEAEMSRFRLLLGSSQSSSFDWPRLDVAKAVRDVTYGLVNVRTDGNRLFFAIREESGPDWGIEVLEAAQIAQAT